MGDDFRERECPPARIFSISPLRAATLSRISTQGPSTLTVTSI
jgi:hypothetical protein